MILKIVCIRVYIFMNMYLAISKVLLIFCNYFSVLHMVPLLLVRCNQLRVRIVEKASAGCTSRSKRNVSKISSNHCTVGNPLVVRWVTEEQIQEWTMNILLLETKKKALQFLAFIFLSRAWINGTVFINVHRVNVNLHVQ